MTGLVRPPTTSVLNVLKSKNVDKKKSIDHLLELLHGQDANSLARWFGLEDTRFLGEGVHSFACSHCRLLLELHVQDTTKLEFAVLLQLTGCELQVRCHHCFHLLCFELS